MSVWIFFKVFGDICLYFSLISMFPTLFSYEFSFLFPALLCSAANGIAALLIEQNRGELRFVCLLFSLAPLVLADGLMEVLVLIPAVVYSSLLILRGLIHMEYYGYRDFFKTSIGVWVVVYLVVCILNFFDTVTYSDRGLLDVSKPLLCILAYFVCGVTLLRQLRLGHSDRRSVLCSGGQLGGLIAGCGLLTWGLVLLERWMLQNQTSLLILIKNVFMSILLSPVILIEGLIELILGHTKDDNREVVPTTDGNGLSDDDGGAAVPQGSKVVRAVEETEETPFPWWLAILLLAVLTVILLVFMKHMKKRETRQKSQERTERNEGLEPKQKRGIRSNRFKVRQLYRSFLKRERRNGMAIHKSDTTEQILNKISANTDPVAAKELRQVYIRARYDENHPVSEEQVTQARAAWSNIRK